VERVERAVLVSQVIIFTALSLEITVVVEAQRALPLSGWGHV
jgi:hypothetical protein